jgi:hypothetical protein
LNAPVVFDANLGGYKYGKPETGEAFELPGLWFTAHELHHERERMSGLGLRSTSARSRSVSTC